MSIKMLKFFYLSYLGVRYILGVIHNDFFGVLPPLDLETLVVLDASILGILGVHSTSSTSSCDTSVIRIIYPSNLGSTFSMTI